MLKFQRMRKIMRMNMMKVSLMIGQTLPHQVLKQEIVEVT